MDSVTWNWVDDSVTDFNCKRNARFFILKSLSPFKASRLAERSFLEQILQLPESGHEAK